MSSLQSRSLHMDVGSVHGRLFIGNGWQLPAYCCCCWSGMRVLRHCSCSFSQMRARARPGPSHAPLTTSRSGPGPGIYHSLRPNNVHRRRIFRRPYASPSGPVPPPARRRRSTATRPQTIHMCAFHHLRWQPRTDAACACACARLMPARC
jgi:hypothetical protein